MNTEASLISDFQTLGLTQNEAKSLLALIKLGGTGEVSKIEQKTDIKRNKIYQALSGLISKKLVLKGEIKRGANTFRLLHSKPSDIIAFLHKSITDPIDQAVERSSQNLLKVAEISEETPQDVWMIKGFSKTVQIEKELINSAKTSIFSNLFPEYIEPIISDLQNALNRGIKIRFVMLEEEVLELNVPLETMCSEHLGINASKLKVLEKVIPIEVNPMLSPILKSLEEFLIIRPNFLFIDSETKNPSALLIIKSTKDPSYSIALHTYNYDFISSFTYLFDFIRNLAINLRMLQDELLPKGSLIKN
jgi:sugar-specific transcriptional regulator TrmB